MTTVPKADTWIQFMTAMTDPIPALPPFPPFPAYTPLPPPPAFEETLAATSHWTEQDWQKSKECIAALKEQIRLNELQYANWREAHIAATEEIDRKWHEWMAIRFPIKANKK